MAYALNEAERTAVFSSNHKLKFCFLVSGSIVFSTAYTLFQERLYRNSDFPAPHGWLTFATFAVYSLLGFLEMALLKGGIGPPQHDRMPVFAGVSALLVVAMYTTNLALHQVPYSIKIVVKSCRVLPTMFLSVALQGVQYSWQQIGAAGVLVLGLGLFLAADSGGSMGLYHPIVTPAVLMLIFSVLLDAITANVEEKYFFRTSPPVSRIEVMAYVSSFATLYCVPPIIYSGEWIHVWSGSAAVPADTWISILLSAVAGYGAMSFMLMLIECCGATTTEIVKNLRKILQVGCSFAFFPKAVSWMHLLGGALVVFGMCLFMQRPKDQDIQKVRQSPKVIDMSDKEAALFHDFRPVDYQIRAVHHKPVEWVSVPSRPSCL